MFKVNNKDTKTTGVFVVNFEHISHLCSRVSIVNFEHVIAGWVSFSLKLYLEMHVNINSFIAEVSII